MSHRARLRRKNGGALPLLQGGLCAHVLGAALLAVVFFLSSPPYAAAQGARAQQYYPGLRTLGIWDAALNMRLDVAVWYPSLRPPREFRLDGWTLTASRNGREVPGRYPLVLVSHDAAANRLSLHDMASALARKGFVVAVPTHPHDSMDDASGMFRASTLQERPLHMLLVLETVLVTPELAPIIDDTRLGLLGVGAGSATVLQLMGAKPDVTKLPAYCLEEPGLDLYCTPWAKRHYPLLEEEFKILLSRQGPTAFTPALTALRKAEAPAAPLPPASEPKPESSQAEPADAPAAMPAPLPNPSPVAAQKQALRRPVRGHSIKAVALVTPGLSALFSSQELQPLSAPVAVLSVAADEVYPAAINAGRLREALPAGTRSLAIPDVAHYALQAPCPQSLAESFPAVCGKTGPQDAKARQTRDTFLGDFFLETLGSPLPPLQEAETPAPKSPANGTVKNPAPVQGNATAPAIVKSPGNATQTSKASTAKNATKRSQPPRRQSR